MRLRQWLQLMIEVSAERYHLSLRLTLSCLLLTLLFLSFQLPFLAVAIIVVFYVTQKNVVLTAGIGLGFIIVALLALGGMLLIIKYTYDTPLIRLVASLFLFFWAMFFMRVLGKLGLAFFVVALVLIYAQTFPSMTGESEVIVRLILWLWMSMVVAIGVTLLVNACFIQAYPHYQFAQHVADLCEETAARLQLRSPLKETAMTMAQHLESLDLLYKIACLTNSDFKKNSQSWYSLSNLSLKSLELAEVYRINPQNTDPQKAEALAQAFIQLAKHARQRQILIQPLRDTAYSDPLLSEIYRLYQQFLTTRTIAPLPGKIEKPPLLLADAWRNPLYLQFALKTLLASLFCYLFYTATAWQGVHTIMLSCVIVAQPGLGATYQKALLRIVGALCAAIAAVVCMVFIQPHLDTVVGLLLMCSPIFLLSAWLAAGSERIAYAGIQLGFTFSLLFLSGFGPMSNLTELRDRVIGIILGVIIASLVYLYLWPDSDAPRLKRHMAKLYQRLAESLEQVPIQPSRNFYHDLAQLQVLANHLEAEPLGSTTHPYPQAIEWPIRESLRAAQQWGFFAMGYQRYATKNDPFLQDAAQALRDYASHIAQGLEYRYPIPVSTDSHNPYADLFNHGLTPLLRWQPVATQTMQEMRNAK